MLLDKILDRNLNLNSQENLDTKTDTLNSVFNEKNDNHIIQYKNTLNQFIFPNFNANDFNFFIALCYIAREKISNNINKSIKISFDEILTLINKKETICKNRNYKKVFHSFNIFCQKMMFITTKNEKVKQEFKFISYINFFEKIILNEKEKYILVKFNNEILSLLTNITHNYTQFELKKFCSLKSKHSKRLYMLLMQYINKGEFIINKKNFCDILNIKNIILEKYFKRDILTPISQELQTIFKDFKYEKNTINNHNDTIFSFKFHL